MLDCDGSNNAKTESDGYTLKWTQEFCGGKEEVLWHVARDGKVTEKARKQLEERDA